MPPTGVPLMNAKAKFKCNFFNNGDVAYVHMSGIFDFVDNFTKYAPKAFKKVRKLWDKICANLQKYLLFKTTKI